MFCLYKNDFSGLILGQSNIHRKSDAFEITEKHQKSKPQPPNVSFVMITRKILGTIAELFFDPIPFTSHKAYIPPLATNNAKLLIIQMFFLIEFWGRRHEALALK